jgi:hypothetical protein
MSIDDPVETGFPTLTLDSAVLLDFDDLMLTGTSKNLLASLAENILLLHRALDGAALIVSGLTSTDLDAALAPIKVPMVASMGWERRWQPEQAIVQDPAPPGVRELYEDLTRVTQGPSSTMVRMTPCGLEADLSVVAASRPDLGATLRRMVSARPGFRTLNRGWRYQIVPSNLRKDHLIDLIADRATFRHRQLVHISDNTLADDAARTVRRLGGVCVRISREAVGEARHARSWSEVLNWLRRAEVSLSTARGHADGFDG